MMASLSNLLRGAHESHLAPLEILTIGTRKNQAVTMLWGSDWHLDHLNEAKRQKFFADLAAKEFDVLVLAGDVELAAADGKRGSQGLVVTLKKMQEAINRPIFFICGNHDYYLGSVEEVRKSVRELSLAKDQIQYVREGIAVKLTPEVVLAGQEGWADGRSGDFFKSEMTLQDFFIIKELAVAKAREIPTKTTLEKMQRLADQSYKYAQRVLPKLFEQFHHVVFLTHVPPFREAAYFQGKPSDDFAVPFFVNQSLGETLMQIMNKRPEKLLTVLCGHTHHERDYWPIPKVFRVIVAKSDYENPVCEKALKL